MKDYTEELKLIYGTITVQIPDVDPKNFKATNETLFIKGLNTFIKTIYSEAYVDGFNDAKDEIREVIKENFNFKNEP